MSGTYNKTRPIKAFYVLGHDKKFRLFLDKKYKSESPRENKTLVKNIVNDNMGKQVLEITE